jgi:NDP-sugar pyrophosphorylase family protein
MNILVLMAGRGQRFRDKGYDKPKPLIEVNGKTILQWTTESCPYINHDGKGQTDYVKLHFAVLQEHLDEGLDKFLYSIYGRNIEIIPFKEITRGSLDTAMQAASRMWYKEYPLLVLDSDNKYNDNGFKDFVRELTFKKNGMAVACFDNPDQSLPNKWSNVDVREGVAKGIREKDDSWVHFPTMIGIFYFGQTQFFTNYAKFIMEFHKPVEFNGNAEYYMSMVPSYNISINTPVYVHEVTDVVPLGTPEDVKRFEESV